MPELEKCRKILIEVNQTCNLNCSYCFYRDYGRIKSLLTVADIVNMLKICPNANEFFLTGGECFTSPNIQSIIELLSKKGEITIFTNGIIIGKYDENTFNKIVNLVNRFIISFDSFDFVNYHNRDRLKETLFTIKRILKISQEKVEVKVCITNQNSSELKSIFQTLINLGVKYLSINFVFDIKNSLINHEVKSLSKLEEIFQVITEYKEYFNEKYIETLKSLYLENKVNMKYPCLADQKYYYLDCANNYLICPGNNKAIGNRGDWMKCYSKECANEWEIMYKR